MKKMTSLIGLAVVSVLVFSANSMAMQSFDEEKTIINFGSTKTKLSQSLSKDYRVKSFIAYKSEESEAQVKANVAAADLLYVNVEDFNGEAPQLNKYLSEAVKQKKLIVFENTQFSDQVTLEALPFSAGAEIMLLKPSYYTNGSQVYLFGNETATVQRHTEQVFIDIPEEIPLVELTPSDAYIEPAETVVERLSGMHGEELSVALGTVKDAIAELQANKVSIKGPSTPNYNCPNEAWLEKLCLTYWSTFRSFSPDDNAHGLVINSQFFTGIYRLQNTTWIVISPYGNISSTMDKDENNIRGFFLESHNLVLDTDPNRDDPDYIRPHLGLASFKPSPTNNKETVTSTTGFTYEINTKDPGAGQTLGGKISYQELNQRSYTIWDWETKNKEMAGGDEIFWENKISKYPTLKDWVRRGWFGYPLGFHEVPDLSAHRFEYSGEALWNGDSDLSDMFHTTLTTQTKIARIDWDGWNSVRKETYTHTYVYTIDVNLGYLKTLDQP